MIVVAIILLVVGAIIVIGGLLLGFAGESEALFGIPLGLCLAAPGIEILCTL